MSAAALNNVNQQILANMTNLLDTNAYDETAASNSNGTNATNAAAKGRFVYIRCFVCI